jgi:hypothetical protein
MKILNSFLYRICNIPYFYNSEELKVFTSGIPDVSKDLNKMKKPKEIELVQIYKNTFTDYYEAYDVLIGKGKIIQFKNYLKNFQNNIKVRKNNFILYFYFFYIIDIQK